MQGSDHLPLVDVFLRGPYVSPNPIPEHGPCFMKPPDRHLAYLSPNTGVPIFPLLVLNITFVAHER